MSAGDFSRYDNMKMLLHHIYEFRKGVRDLVLCTLCPTCAGLLIERLRSQGIDYLLQPLGYDISMQCERYCKRKFHLSGLIA